MNVSVIIPAHNVADTIVCAARSALQQSHRPVDVVVVDDGSTDGTVERITAEEGVTLLKQPNSGVSAARNAGAAVAGGDWFLFLDADDELADDAMHYLTASVKDRPDCAVHYGRIRVTGSGVTLRFSGDAKSEGPVPAATVANFERSAIITPGAVLISRALFERIGGFSEQYDTVADRDIYLRAGLESEFKFCSHIVVNKRQREDSMSRGDRPRVFRQGLQVQWDFIDRFSGAPTFPRDEGIRKGAALDTAILRGLELGDRQLLLELLDMAKSRGVRTTKSRLLNAVPSVVIAHYRVMRALERARSKPRHAVSQQ